MLATLCDSTCIRNPVWVLPRRRLGVVICSVAAFLLSLMLGFIFELGTGATVLAPLLSSEECAGGG